MKHSSLNENLFSKYKGSLLSKKEVAIELRSSVSSIDRLRKNGVLKAKMVGGKVFYTVDEIACFLASNDEGK